MSRAPKFQRMIDKTQTPTDEEMVRFIGEQTKPAWRDIRQFLEDHYDILPETIFYGTKYGWTIRYRKSGKTLCSLFPEKDGFTVLITLGRKESGQALAIPEELSATINTLLRNTEQLHDGQWLWIRVHTTSDNDDVKKLLQIKRKPKLPRTRRSADACEGAD